MANVDKHILDEIALTEEEYSLIVELIGREPNSVELGIFGALWSEHCGYKHSKHLLSMLPTEGPRVIFPAGSENAGVMDIGDGLAVVFKIESHNHPSAVEPFQGAATGVGGIVRDILAMGARPIALLNSLRFGPLYDQRNRYLLDGVVGGISWYGNCIGVPDVGGEISFSSAYSNNPLVNAFCVGVVEKDKLYRSSAGGDGNSLMLVGSETGRDGIHGASGLASKVFEPEGGMRPAVQMANPFLKKILIEACLDIVNTGYLEGVQDLGAAGLTSSTVEAAEKGGGGIWIDVDRVHRREKGMTPYEVMLSESQERMLLVVKDGYQETVKEIISDWDIPIREIGRVNRDHQVRVYDGDNVVADLPVSVLTSPKVYTVEGTMGQDVKEAQSYNMSNLPLTKKKPDEILLSLLGSSNISSKESIFRQYDHQVQTNTVLGPGGDAAVLRIKGTDKSIAICTDGNGRFCYLDPYIGGAIAVAEACRNLSCVGAEPIGLTDCLNFGNPERPDIYYQLEWCIKGITEACKVLEIPVVSGNVSLYNETNGMSIYPTPVIGGLGLLEDVSKCISFSFKDEGDLVVVVGCNTLDGDLNNLAGSEYLEYCHDKVLGRPFIDLLLEKRVQSFCRRAIKEGILKSAHDCSEGGLAVTIAESCIGGGLGFNGDFEISGRWDSCLFGESQSRIIVSLPLAAWSDFMMLAAESNVPTLFIGKIGGSRFKMGGLVDLSMEEIDDSWRNSLSYELK